MEAEQIIHAYRAARTSTVLPVLVSARESRKYGLTLITLLNDHDSRSQIEWASKFLLHLTALDDTPLDEKVLDELLKTCPELLQDAQQLTDNARQNFHNAVNLAMREVSEMQERGREYVGEQERRRLYYHVGTFPNVDVLINEIRYPAITGVTPWMDVIGELYRTGHDVPARDTLLRLHSQSNNKE